MASVSGEKPDHKPDLMDQGFTHHILTYKTKNVYMLKRDFKMDVIASRMEEILGNKEFEPALFNA